jgi:hypothetical protein
MLGCAKSRTNLGPRLKSGANQSIEGTSVRAETRRRFALARPVLGHIKALRLAAT